MVSELAHLERSRAKGRSPLGSGFSPYQGGPEGGPVT